MNLVKTQKILYNHEIRIRLISDNEDPDYIRLVRKLPDCRWSNYLNSWHTSNIQNHISFLNKVFPSSVRFYDISGSSLIPRFEEDAKEKRICIKQDQPDNSMTLSYLYDNELTSFIKTLGASSQKANTKEWKLSNNQEITENLKLYLRKANYKIDYVADREENKMQKVKSENLLQQEERFREFLKSLSYKKRTIEQYIYTIRRFLQEKNAEEMLTVDSINEYINDMAICRDYSHSYLNQLINSLKVYFQFLNGEKIGKKQIHRPKIIRSMPTILTGKEVEKIIGLISNLKHNTIISTISMTGITVGEAVMIKPEDVNTEIMLIKIRGRNKKAGRSIPLENELVQKIVLYLNHYHPQHYLFEGYQGKQYTERGIQKIISKYAQKAGITGKASVQTLRHSFASRLIARGTEIKTVQELLGHKCSRTTQFYSHFSSSQAWKV